MIEEKTMGLSLTLPGASSSSNHKSNHHSSRNYSKLLKQRHSTITKKAKQALKKAELAEKRKKKAKIEAEEVAKLSEWSSHENGGGKKGNK
jgi:hypothetical protein